MTLTRTASKDAFGLSSRENERMIENNHISFLCKFCCKGGENWVDRAGAIEGNEEKSLEGDAWLISCLYSLQISGRGK